MEARHSTTQAAFTDTGDAPLVAAAEPPEPEKTSPPELRRLTTLECGLVINAIRAVSTVALCLDADDLDAFVREADYEAAFMPFFDPTAYMRGGRESIEMWRDVAQAALAFRRTIAKYARTAEDLHGR